MFYDEKFSAERFKIGLRYNETWVDDAVKFGHRRDHIRLCCIVRHENAVMTSWRDSTLVPPLTSIRPKVAKGESPDSDSVVTIGGETKALVVDSTPLSELFSPQVNATFMIVSEKGITKMSYKNYRWMAEEL